MARTERALRVAGGVAFAALLLALGAELALAVAARFAPDRSSAWRPDAQVRVLCVGDSHTFGAGVADEESYPARLQAELDLRAPRRFSVINLGTPGMSSGQVRERLPLQLARYRPDAVILWVGVNNAWNLAGAPARSARAAERLEALALRSRLYRLLRVGLHDLALERAAEDTRADGRHQAVDKEDCRGEECAFKAQWRLRHGGVVDVVTHRQAPERDPEGVAERAASDLRAAARTLRGAGIGLLLVRYPLDVGPFARANGGIDAAGRELGIPVADTHVALGRLAPDETAWEWGNHPSAALYREIARELAPLVEELAAR